MSRRILSAVLIFIMMLSMISCSEIEEEEKRSLSVWVLSEDYADYIGWTVENYCSDMGWQADIEVVNIANIEQMIIDSEYKGKIPDIIMLPPESIEAMAKNGTVAPLSSIGFRFDERGCYDFAINTGKFDGKLYAMCWHASPGLFAYRRSIAEAYLGTGEPAEIEALIDDNESFLEVAQLLKVSSAEKTYILAGLSDITRTYFKGNFSDISEDGVKAYFEFLKTLCDEDYVYGADQWSEAWIAGLNDSSTIFGYYLSGIAVTDVLFPVCRESMGDWGAAVPYNPYAWGGAYLSVYSGSDSTEDAVELISILTANESVMTKSSLYSGIFTANKAVNGAVSSDSQFESPVFGGQNYFRVLMRSAERIDSVQSSEDAMIISLLNTCAENYVSGEYELSAALQTFFASLDSYIG